MEQGVRFERLFLRLILTKLPQPPRHYLAYMEQPTGFEPALSWVKTKIPSPVRRRLHLNSRVGLTPPFLIHPIVRRSI